MGDRQKVRVGIVIATTVTEIHHCRFTRKWMDGAWMLSLSNYLLSYNKIKQKSLNHLYRSQFNCTPPTIPLNRWRPRLILQIPIFIRFPGMCGFGGLVGCTILYIIIIIVIFARNQFETCCNNIRRYRKSDNNKNSPSAPANHRHPSTVEYKYRGSYLAAQAHLVAKEAFLTHSLRLSVCLYWEEMQSEPSSLNRVRGLIIIQV